MGKKTRKASGNPQRSVTPEMRRDKHAGNMLETKSKNYENSNDKPRVGKNRVYKSKKGQTQHQIMVRNAQHKKKQQRVYSEKELGIPKLNKSIDPEGIQRGKQGGGKKGKKLISDEDNNTLSRIVNQVNQEQNSVQASKLERAQQLEEIREQKRKDIEQKEAEKERKLEQKKSQMKKSSSASKRGNKRLDDGNNDEPKSKPKGKRVAFA